MYRRLSIVLFPFLVLALVGAGVWGYQENREKNTVLIKAENQYQRAFHELSFHMDSLHDELGKTLAVNSTNQDFYRKGLINVWRLTSQAQSDINQLPLTLLPFNQTEEFLDNIAKFSYRTAVRDLQSKPLSTDEVKTLQSLYNRSKELSVSLQQVQDKVIANNLRWMDVEIALASQDKTQDNTIVDGFQTVNKRVTEYSELNWGPSLSSVYMNRGMQALSGNDVTPQEAKAKVVSFLGLDANAPINVIENGAGTEFSSYTIRVDRQGDLEDMNIEITKRGGQILMFMAPRKIDKAVLDVRGARDAASEFLDTHGYGDVTPVAYDQYENVASITFASRSNDIIIYPEKLMVKVAMDTGEVVGFTATDYVYEKKDRSGLKPTLDQDKAKKELNPGFEVFSQSLALIRNDLDEEVLCYQFYGKINGNLYKVFINASNGYEEKIEVIGPDDVEQAAQKK